MLFSFLLGLFLSSVIPNSRLYIVLKGKQLSLNALFRKSRSDLFPKQQCSILECELELELTCNPQFW